MSDELKAAVERLRKCELNSTSWDSGLEPTYRKDYTLFGRDTNELAHAYLAEHPEPKEKNGMKLVGTTAVTTIEYDGETYERSSEGCWMLVSGLFDPCNDSCSYKLERLYQELMK